MQNKIFEQEKKDYLSIGEASEYLGISIDTLRRWEKKERITAYRSPGGHRYFQKEDLKGLFSARYTRDAPTKRRKKEIEPEVKTKAVKTEVKEKVVTKPRIIIEERSIPNSITTDSTEKTKVVDWSGKYTNKQARKVRIPLTRSVMVRTNHAQTTSNHQPIQQVPTNTLVPPVALQSQVVQNNQFSNSPILPSPANNLFRKWKIIISVILIIVLISFVIFFYWYSQPRILSPIP